jgi:hypothetical protein
LIIILRKMPFKRGLSLKKIASSPQVGQISVDSRTVGALSLLFNPLR